VIPIVVAIFVVTLTVLVSTVVIVPTVVIVFASEVVSMFASEVVSMFAIICMGPFELACPRVLLLAATLGFRAAAVVRIIFPGAYEVDRSVTCLVLVTVFPPVSSVFGRNVQIKRRDADLRGGGVNDHRTCVDNWRRSAGSQIHAAVNTGDDFSPDCDSDTHITGVCDRPQRNVRQGKQDGGSEGIFHRVISKARMRANSSAKRPSSHTVSTGGPVPM
jgi:hypothetical protein